MKIQKIKSGFTLIELLVVITIIGILATGAVTVYTSQIQKARDTTRINDIKALQAGVEQVYQDTGEYPHTDLFFTSVSPYVEKFPKDPKHAQPCSDGGNSANAPDCAYSYITGADNNGISYGEYEISTAFENSGNVTEKAAKDGGGSGVDLTRYEIGLDVATNVSTVAKDAVTTTGNGACTVGGAKAGNGTTLIVINGNPGTAANECD